jgi:hypothetical protein
MSLPSNACCEYNKRVEENSKEFSTLNSLKKGVDWVKG